MRTDAVYALIHSPLVGVVTWQPVARAMIERGAQVTVPVLADSPDSPQPFWKQHAESARQMLAEIPAEQPIVYVAHSGAGALLPALRHMLENPAAGYIFVDAGLPRGGASRLDVMRDESPEWAESFHQSLGRGERFPSWTGDDLRDLIPDDLLREALVAGIQPRALPFFTEPIPVFDSWPDAPCAVIRFSAPYSYAAEQARERGWPVTDMPAGHFHMLVDASAVAEAILGAL